MKVDAPNKDNKNDKFFISVTDLGAKQPRPSTNERVDIIGIVHNLGNVRMIEHTNKYRMNVELVDPMTEPYQSIILCIWEKKDDKKAYGNSQNEIDENKTVHDDEIRAAAKVVERI